MVAYELLLIVRLFAELQLCTSERALTTWKVHNLTFARYGSHGQNAPGPSSTDPDSTRRETACRRAGGCFSED